VRDGWALHSLYCDLGQRNGAAATASAERIADRFCVSHKSVRLDGGDYLHLNHYGYHSIVCQSLALLTLGAMEAVRTGAEAVASGVRVDVVDWDTREKWAALLPCFRNMKVPPEFLWPIFRLNEEEVRALVWSDPWQETVTCNFDPPCGGCYKCKVRAAWLAMAPAEKSDG
jgi:7-cyano-7-deazaguanine synthase in queuosine biosynthesis